MCTVTRYRVFMASPEAREFAQKFYLAHLAINTACVFVSKNYYTKISDFLLTTYIRNLQHTKTIKMVRKLPERTRNIKIPLDLPQIITNY